MNVKKQVDSFVNNVLNLEEQMNLQVWYLPFGFRGHSTFVTLQTKKVLYNDADNL